jgi:hypothetical protein
MASEKNGKKNSMGSKCENCGGSYWGTCGHWNGWHFVLRLALGIIILVCVFWGGFQLGLIIGASNSGYGSGYGMRGMMRSYLNGYNGYQYGPGMMGGWYYPTATSTK